MRYITGLFFILQFSGCDMDQPHELSVEIAKCGVFTDVQACTERQWMGWTGDRRTIYPTWRICAEAGRAKLGSWTLSGTVTDWSCYRAEPPMRSNMARGAREIAYPESVAGFVEEARQGDTNALTDVFDGLVFRAKDLRRANPALALSVWATAVQANPLISVPGLETIKQCAEVGEFDGAAFLTRHGLDAEYDEGTVYAAWELAEDAANTTRFGPPDPSLVLQLVCRGGWVPAEVRYAVDDVYASWQQGVVHPFDLCQYVTSAAGTGFCQGREEARLAQQRESLDYPKVENHTWIVEGREILPTCMETEWLSGDNYDEYLKQYPQAADFFSYPGRYWGDVIPLDPIEASWGEKVALPRKVAECNTLVGVTAVRSENFVEIDDPNVTHREEQNSYRLLAEWGKRECEALVPFFVGNCKSLAFVYRNEKTQFSESYVTYALLTDTGADYVVPVTNGLQLSEILELL